MPHPIHLLATSRYLLKNTRTCAIKKNGRLYTGTKRRKKRRTSQRNKNRSGNTFCLRTIRRNHAHNNCRKTRLVTGKPLQIRYDKRRKLPQNSQRQNDSLLHSPAFRLPARKQLFPRSNSRSLGRNLKRPPGLHALRFLPEPDYLNKRNGWRLAVFKKHYYAFTNTLSDRLAKMLSITQDAAYKLQLDILFFASSTAICAKNFLRNFFNALQSNKDRQRSYTGIKYEPYRSRPGRIRQKQVQ